MSKSKAKKAASVAAQKIKDLSNPTHGQIREIYQEFQQYAHMP